MSVEASRPLHDSEVEIRGTSGNRVAATLASLMGDPKAIVRPVAIDEEDPFYGSEYQVFSHATLRQLGWRELNTDDALIRVRRLKEWGGEGEDAVLIDTDTYRVLSTTKIPPHILAQMGQILDRPPLIERVHAFGSRLQRLFR